MKLPSNITGIISLLVVTAGIIFIKSGEHRARTEAQEISAETQGQTLDGYTGIELQPGQVPNNPPNQSQLTLLTNKGYAVGYNESLGGPAWVSYTLNWAKKPDEYLRRPDIPFATDERTSAKIPSEALTHSKFDRGHMAPSYAIGVFCGREAQAQTFTMSNILPQTHLCNDGVWNSIERMEADDFAKRFGEILVIDGPVYASPHPTTISKWKVAVPDAFFKVIQRPDGQTICFIVPQRPTSPKPEDYLVSINDITTATGLDFFPDANPEEKARRRTKIW